MWEFNHREIRLWQKLILKCLVILNCYNWHWFNSFCMSLYHITYTYWEKVDKWNQIIEPCNRLEEVLTSCVVMKDTVSTAQRHKKLEQSC